MILKPIKGKRTWLLAGACALFSLTAIADNVLHYNAPAEYFEEALPVGNGNLGALVYGRPDIEKISLNDITLWTGEPEKNVLTDGAREKIAAVREALDHGDYAAADSLQKFLQGHYAQNYQPLGNLTIRFANGRKALGYRRSLDLDRAVATTLNGSLSETVFASAPDSVIVVRLADAGGLDASLKLESQLPVTISAEGNEIVMDGYTAYMSYPGYFRHDGGFSYDPGRGIHFRTILKVLAPEGSVAASGDSLMISGCDAATILISDVSSFNGFDKDPVKEGRDYKPMVRRRIDHAAGRGYDALAADAEADHRRLFGRVTLDLGTTAPEIAKLPTDVQLKRYTDSAQVNPDLEELYYQYGRYLLIACSRTPGVPANLQGLWNESLTPPWSSNYTTNINLEENYWGAENGNLPEMHNVLLDYIDNLTVSGAATAHNNWGVDRGWALGHNTDIWAMTNPIGLCNDRPQWANWCMGGAWLSTHIWENYLFSRDTDALRRRYPALKGAAEFCLGWLVDRNGVLTVYPSTSPENNFFYSPGKSADTSIGTTSDISMIRECLVNTRNAAGILGVDNALFTEIDSVLPRLQPYAVKSDGSLNEWSENFVDCDPQHRHQSHLFGLYPGHLITSDGTPNLAKAAARTLEIKGKETTGWSAGWRVNLLARLKDSEGAYAMLRRLLRYVSPDNYKGPDRRRGGGTYPNLLDAHAPFQIDGNFGGSAGITEMLVQSTPDVIELLPACPSEWPDGSISGIRTRTGAEVSISWKNGRAVSATVSAPVAVTATLRANGTDYPLSLIPGQTKTITF